MRRQRLVVVGSGWQAFREYALEAMSRRADLVLLLDEEPTWQTRHVVSHHVLPDLSTATVSAVIGAERPDGVVTYDETLVEAVAQAAQAHHLPHPGAAVVRRCKDKHALRAALAAAGVSPVGYALAHSAPAAAAAAAAIGYPVVLKPRALQASIGVVRVDDEPALLAAFDGVASAQWHGITSGHPGVVVEEYLAGPEYSVDCVTWRGVTTPLVLAEKRIGPAPYFEEVGHVVPAAPVDGMSAALDVVAAAHRALGVDRLVTHSEFRLTPSGPRIIEVNPRLGGDLIPYLGVLASGVDVAGAAASVALDLEPDVSSLPMSTALVGMVYPEHDIRVADVRLRREHEAYPGLDRFLRLAAAGEEIRLPPRGYVSRLAVVTVTGADLGECEKRWRHIESDVIVEGRPLPV